MRASHLSLVDFRNYAHAELQLEAGPNLFVGRNGQGKTNLVEALGYLSTLGSHRVSSDQALIRQGQDAAIIRARLTHAARQVLAEVQINRSAPNRALINRSPVKSRELPRYFASVLFAPEDLALVKGDPSVRRRFLDQLLILRSPRLQSVMADYERILKQRNSLLKSARASNLKAAQLSTLDIWDERLVETGSEIIVQRNDLIGSLRNPLQSAYSAVAGADHGPQLSAYLSIDDDDGDRGAVDEYVDGASYVADRFRKALHAVRRSELERGITLVGPHRDDVVFELNSLPAKGYASHGESWSFALALKLASADLLRHESPSGDPVLILDDVFAELDQARRRRLADAIGHYEQVLITAAVLEDIPESIAAHTVRIEAGAIVDSGEQVVRAND